MADLREDDQNKYKTKSRFQVSSSGNLVYNLRKAGNSSFQWQNDVAVSVTGDHPKEVLMEISRTIQRVLNKKYIGMSGDL